MIAHPRILPSIALAGALAGALAASACAIPFGRGGGEQTAQQPASDAAVADCRLHADQVFAQHNPDHVYRTDDYQTDTRDAPFASTGMRGVISAPLPQQYARDDTMDECMRASGYGTPAPASRNLRGELPVGH